ncbi:DedA family protein [Actinokineospora bangkokensis]|uniref:VTT domain-containing protein n=1 Tax=Actinokineospora bangkokensis TaxID=1193682 RepID=A0A1Q9LLC5_9PSEU|nr:DedA family protein [Actinokineospora bangkokensis]OLR92836.1 hypothetical protein BJP25_19640 [Actinokineospora bangkokensis]
MLDPVSEPTGITGWVVGVMEAVGAPGAGLAIAVENLFPPLPSEVFLPLAGFTAQQGHMNLLAAIIWTTAGSVVGALALYWLGASLGAARIRALVDRMPLVKVEDVDKTQAWFDRHGRKAVFLGRMVPLFRSFISIPAGVQRMSLVEFTLLTGAGSLIWNTALILAGYLLGTQWYLVEQYAGVFSKVVLGLLAAAVVWFVVRRVRGRAKQH